MKDSVKRYAFDCIKMYEHSPNKPFFTTKSKVDDWIAARNIICQMDSFDQIILSDVFTRTDTLVNNVKSVAKKHGINDNWLWKFINNVSRAIAKERGIL